MRKARITKSLILCFLFVLTGCSSTFQVTMSDTSIIKVGSKSMDEKQAMLLLMNMKCSYEEQYVESYGEDFWDNEMESEYTYEEYFLDNDYLNELCALLYMQGRAEKAGITISEEEEKLIEEAAAEYYDSLSTEEKEYVGGKASDVEELYESYLIADKWIGNIAKDIPSEISEEEARIVQIKQIYVTDLATAEEVWNQAMLGANFDSLAAVYNKSEEYICYLSRESREERVSKQIFALRDGEISEILEENGGYYIVMCVNSYEEERTQANKENVYRQNVYECWHEDYQKNIKNEKISINNRLWNRIDLSYNENISNHTIFDVYNKYFTD